MFTTNTIAEPPPPPAAATSSAATATTAAATTATVAATTATTAAATATRCPVSEILFLSHRRVTSTLQRSLLVARPDGFVFRPRSSRSLNGLVLISEQATKKRSIRSPECSRRWYVHLSGVAAIFHGCVLILPLDGERPARHAQAQQERLPPLC